MLLRKISQGFEGLVVLSSFTVEQSKKTSLVLSEHFRNHLPSDKSVTSQNT